RRPPLTSPLLPYPALFRSAIFSLFNQLLLRPLPVLEPDRLVNLGAPGLKPGSQSCSQAGECEPGFGPGAPRITRRTGSSTGGGPTGRAQGGNTVTCPALMP